MSNWKGGRKGDKARGKGGKRDAMREWSDDELEHSLQQLKYAATCLVKSWKCMNACLLNCHWSPDQALKLLLFDRRCIEEKEGKQWLAHGQSDVLWLHGVQKCLEHPRIGKASRCRIDWFNIPSISSMTSRKRFVSTTLKVNLVCIDDFSWLWYIYIHYSYIHSHLPVTKCYQSGYHHSIYGATTDWQLVREQQTVFLTVPFGWLSHQEGTLFVLRVTLRAPASTTLPE